MKKCLLFCSITILSFFLCILIFLNVVINIKVYKNKDLLATFNSVFLKEYLDITLEYDTNFPKIEIDGTDYIGIINVLKDNLLLPVESVCNRSFSSACSYSNNLFIILGTNLKNSFKSYMLYDIGDIIMFTNTLGQTFRYKINTIKRINKINEISQYKEDLIIVIKNYYSMEYILFICKFN